MDVVNPAVRDAEMLTANLAVRLLLAPVAGHNPVERSCIFCIKFDSLLYRIRFFAGLIPGDDSRFAILLSSTGSNLSNTDLSDLSTVGTCDIFVYQMRHRVM